jgi:hypothetical protein
LLRNQRGKFAKLQAIWRFEQGNNRDTLTIDHKPEVPRIRIFREAHKSRVARWPHDLVANLPNSFKVYFFDHHARKIINKMCVNA